MTAIIIQYLPYLFKAAVSIPQIFEFIKKTRESLKQNKMWNNEAEAAFTKELDDLETNPPAWWKPDTK